MAKGLSYEEFQELAMQNYENGGDTYVECWGQQEFAEYTEKFGPMTKTKAKQMFKTNASIESEYEAAARWYSGEDGTDEKENEATNNSKEDKNMKRAQGAVEVMDFEFDGVRYTNTRPGYYYKKVDGKQTRIGKAEWDAAWEASGEAERQAREAEAAKSDKEAEKKMGKKTATARKPRKSKDIAFEGCGVTLTARQVEFLKELPKSEVWDGYENGVWCDCIADEIGWNPMSVGAMISTLREKGLVRIDVQKVNGKKCKGMLFTDLGLDVVKEMGLR